MAKESKKQKFSVMAEVAITTSLEIIAEDFDDALNQAKNLKYKDFLAKLDIFDDSLKLTGISSL